MAFWDTVKKIGQGVLSVAKATVKTVANVATGFATGGIGGAIQGAVNSVKDIKTASTELKNIVSTGTSVVKNIKDSVPKSSNANIPVSASVVGISASPKLYSGNNTIVSGNNQVFNAMAYNLETAKLRG